MHMIADRRRLPVQTLSTGEKLYVGFAPESRLNYQAGEKELAELKARCQPLLVAEIQRDGLTGRGNLSPHHLGSKS